LIPSVRAPELVNRRNIKRNGGAMPSKRKAGKKGRGRRKSMKQTVDPAAKTLNLLDVSAGKMWVLRERDEEKETGGERNKEKEESQ